MKVKCNRTGTPSKRNALTVPAVAPRSTEYGQALHRSTITEPRVNYAQQNSACRRPGETT